MSDTSKTTHNVAVFKSEGFVVVEVEAEIIEDYTEARALRIVGAHPAVAKYKLPVLLAWVDEDEDLEVYGAEEATEAAEEMGLDYESIRWSQEITVDWPDADEEDEDEEDDEDDEDEDEDEEDEDDDDDGEDEDEEAVKPAPKPVVKPTPKPVVKPAPTPAVKPAPAVTPAPKPAPVAPAAVVAPAPQVSPAPAPVAVAEAPKPAPATPAGEKKDDDK